jgi:hypothetical protein
MNGVDGEKYPRTCPHVPIYINKRRRWLEGDAYKRNVGTDPAFLARTTSPEATVLKMRVVGRYTSWVEIRIIQN